LRFATLLGGYRLLAGQLIVSSFEKKLAGVTPRVPDMFPVRRPDQRQFTVTKAIPA
jgi:hypothetical protein